MNVTVITGASEGIGAEMATQLARTKGAAVALVLAARQASKLESVAAACRQHGAGMAFGDALHQMIERPNPTRGNDRHAHGIGNRAGEIEIIAIARAIPIH